MVLHQKQQISRCELNSALTLDLMNDIFVAKVNVLLHGSENFTFSKNAKALSHALSKSSLNAKYLLVLLQESVVCRIRCKFYLYQPSSVTYPVIVMLFYQFVLSLVSTCNIFHVNSLRYHKK